MGWRDWFRPGAKEQTTSGIEYGRFFDPVAYANEHHMTIADALCHNGIDADIVRIALRYNIYALTRRKLLANENLGDIQPELREGDHPFSQLTNGTAASIDELAGYCVLLTLKRANFPENMEGDQACLAFLWAEIVTRHYTELAALAASAQVPIDRDQTARLYRQVCIFYDVLWHYELHQRILDTGRISREQMSRYVEDLREATMAICTEHENAPISRAENSIFAQPEELQEDYDFYVNGKLSRPHYEEDYTTVFNPNFLNSIGIQVNGTYVEPVARLHFRTCQILDLTHRLSLMEMRWWCYTQSALACESIRGIISKVIPVP